MMANSTPHSPNSAARQVAFVDFEASSLSRKSYPIEVGWALADGRTNSFLIKPAPDWTDWSLASEVIHGITREQIETAGVPFREVASEMLRVLSDYDLYASAPSWDGKWLSLLLRTAGLPRHALRLKKSDDLFEEVALRIIGPAGTEEVVSSLVKEVIQTTTSRTTHRALGDAQLEFERWQLVKRAAKGLGAGVSLR